MGICLTIIFTITYRFDAAQVVRVFFHVSLVVRYSCSNPSPPTCQGLTHLSGLVGTVLAISVTILSDRVIIWMSQRNHGIYEREYRLVFMLSLLFCVFSYVGWGIGNDHHMPWMAAVVCIAYVPPPSEPVYPFQLTIVSSHTISPPPQLCAHSNHPTHQSGEHHVSSLLHPALWHGRTVTFSNAIAYGTAVTYLFDAHGADAQHILSLTNAARQLILYGSTFFADGFILSHGVKVSLLILGACQAVSLLLCIPMYVYRKRVRSFVSIHSFTGICFIVPSVLVAMRGGGTTNAERNSDRSRATPIFSPENPKKTNLDHLQERRGLARSVERAVDPVFPRTALRALVPHNDLTRTKQTTAEPCMYTIYYALVFKIYVRETSKPHVALTPMTSLLLRFHLFPCLTTSTC